MADSGSLAIKSALLTGHSQEEPANLDLLPYSRSHGPPILVTVKLVGSRSPWKLLLEVSRVIFTAKSIGTTTTVNCSHLSLNPSMSFTHPNLIHDHKSTPRCQPPLSHPCTRWALTDGKEYGVSDALNNNWNSLIYFVICVLQIVRAAVLTEHWTKICSGGKYWCLFLISDRQPYLE